MSTLIPAIDGWFTLGAAPALIGRCCRACGTYHFPPTAWWCANPACDGDRLETVELSRRGRVWSYTDARYQPPPPYEPPGGEHHPFAIVAVELERERLVVLGQVASGYGVDDLAVGTQVELVVEPLGGSDDVERMVWKWRPLAATTTGPGS